MTFARNAAVNGDWMLTGALDKPPLSIYSSAVSMIISGITSDAGGVLQLDVHRGELSARLPNVLYAILLVALMMRLAHDLYHQSTVTLLAGIITATSPYLLAFGATAFTDMSLLFWGTFALWLSVRQRYGWAGLALGLAFWSKQQAIFFVPIITIVSMHQITAPSAHQRRRRALGVIMLLVMLGLLMIWDATRIDTSIFVLGTLNNTPDSLIAPTTDYLPRLAKWSQLGVWLLGHPIVTVGLVGMAIAGHLWAVLQGRHQRIDSVFILIIMAYIAGHTVLAFNQYDRYLLILLPMLVMFCARGLYHIVTIRQTQSITVFLASSAVLLALITTSNTIPIGGDKGAHTGIDNLADYLNSKPVATVIYDPWLGWELGYYMGQWTNKRRVHYPTPTALVADALELDEVGLRYLVAPADVDPTDWLQALEHAQFEVTLDHAQDNFRVYRIRP